MSFAIKVRFIPTRDKDLKACKGTDENTRKSETEGLTQFSKVMAETSGDLGPNLEIKKIKTHQGENLASN